MPKLVEMFDVGGMNPGISPIRFENRMYKNRVPKSGR
jgi:hypothetical protein